MAFNISVGLPAIIKSSIKVFVITLKGVFKILDIFVEKGNNAIDYAQVDNGHPCCTPSSNDSIVRIESLNPYINILLGEEYIA